MTPDIRLVQFESEKKRLEVLSFQPAEPSYSEEKCLERWRSGPWMDSLNITNGIDTTA